MRNSMFDDTGARLGLAPAVRSANAVVQGPSVDMAGAKNNFRVALLVAVAGAITDGTHTVSLEHSDTGAGGWTATVAGEHEGAPLVFNAASQNTTGRIGYLGTKRYVRAVITTTGAPGSPVGGTVGAVFALGQGSGRPVT